MVAGSCSLSRTEYDCGCNKQTYNTASSCVAGCKVSLRCFVGICVPKKVSYSPAQVLSRVVSLRSLLSGLLKGLLAGLFLTAVLGSLAMLSGPLAILAGLGLAALSIPPMLNTLANWDRIGPEGRGDFIGMLMGAAMMALLAGPILSLTKGLSPEVAVEPEPPPDLPPDIPPEPAPASGPLNIDPDTGLPTQIHNLDVEMGPPFASRPDALPGQNVAEVTVSDSDGNVIGHWWEVSEEGLGQLGHTEQKALSRINLEPGMTIEFTADAAPSPCTYPPSSCHGGLDVIASTNNVDIIYNGPQGTTYYEGGVGHVPRSR
jgi:hypothetical protein